MDESGLLEQLAQSLRVPRQGGYCGLDVLLLLVAYLCWGAIGGIKKFSRHCAGWGKQLAALGGRKRWASVSRFLGAVRAADCQDLQESLLGPKGQFAALCAHPCTQLRDSRGQSWLVLDFDPCVRTLRQRALPKGPTLPPAQRCAEQIAKPGYPGRKRGEVQVSSARLQQAGSGLWSFALSASRVAKGPGDACSEVAAPAARLSSRACFTPPPVPVAGPWQMAGPLLVPSELRKQMERLSDPIQVLVTVQQGPR